MSPDATTDTRATAPAGPGRTGTRSAAAWAVLGLLAEGPAHGFALARTLSPQGDLGRILTVRRPLVYRAVDRLVHDGAARTAGVEPGDGGPRRTVHAITERGRGDLEAWLSEPVDHVRDLRIEFLLKLALLRRSGRPAHDLARRQRGHLDGVLRAAEHGPDDEVGLWRRHNAAAVDAFLAEVRA